MTTMRKILSAIYVVPLLLAMSCQEHIMESIDDFKGNKDGSIAFRLGALTLTRGTPQVSLAAYEKVYMCSYSYSNTQSYDSPADLATYRDIELENTDGSGLVWDYSPRMFFPDGRKLAIMAFAIDLPMGDAGIEITRVTPNDVPIIDYNVPYDVTHQPDLIVATPLFDKEVNSYQNNIVPLQMNHALSCVSFYGTSQKPNRYIYSVTFTDIATKGHLSLDKDPTLIESWDLNPVFDDFILGNNPAVQLDETLDINNLAKLMNGDGYLMMLPQTLGDNATISVVYWDGTNPASQETPVIVPLKNTTVSAWQPGLKYVYYLDETASGVVVYYEIYADNSFGLYDCDNRQGMNTNNPIQTGRDMTTMGKIIEAGYGVFIPSTAPADVYWSGECYSASDTYVPLQTPLSVLGVNPNTNISINNLLGESGSTPVVYNLYPITQTVLGGRTPFNLAGGGNGSTAVGTTHPGMISFMLQGGSTLFVAENYCIPHFARGVYNDRTPVSEHYIRTPQQMINISRNTAVEYEFNATYQSTFYQEHDLNFANANLSIGGAASYSTSIVSGNFRGMYDGMRYRTNSDNLRIYNLSITSGSSLIGLFQRNGAQGTIQYLNIDQACGFTSSSSSTSAASGCGSFVGRNSGYCKYLINTGTVMATNGHRNVGGIMGMSDYQDYAKVEYCENLGEVISNGGSVGGIVGWLDASTTNQGGSNASSVKNCTNKGNITSTYTGSPYVNGTGGIVGAATAGYGNCLIQYCVNYASVTGTNQVGGIVGVISSKVSSGSHGNIAGESFVQNCAFYGNNSAAITGTNYIGGIIGHMLKDDTGVTPDAGETQQTVAKDNIFISTNPTPFGPMYAPDQYTNIGGIVGICDVNSIIGNALYIAVAPSGNYYSVDYIYPILGSDGGAVFSQYYYTLTDNLTYNILPTRYNGIVLGSLKLTTALMSSTGGIINMSLSDTNLPVSNGILFYLSNDCWVYPASGCPYPIPVGIAAPPAGQWPIAN